MTTDAPASDTAERRRLDRQQIVNAAIDYMDTHGVQALTMRKLGAELGVEAMSIYRYVPGREALLEAVVSHLLEGLPQRLDRDLTQTWQGYIQAYSHEVRKIAVEHPSVFPLIATKHPAAPWLRPPLRSVELVEDLIMTLSQHDFTDEQVVDTYRAFTSFLLGNLLLHCAAHGVHTGPMEEPLDEGEADKDGGDAQRSLRDAPTVRRLKPLLAEDRSEEEFEKALESLLDRIEMTLSH
ncbi:MAG TPA: TetR family transcriptional regulator [Ornithinimicrobium sp.]|uniref:TetR/AcrR family transcriptional regulator n=1 Tax=Ornithinimicrobium sp. TaxID=1977084 RepID=UPI002B46FF2D|nr:TetR family transcriptional regulator [Ornithinimicrobium sp.]HKJ12261.1 TetR family transcriptional regulator [Ornithinimicrobium sp.]